MSKVEDGRLKIDDSFILTAKVSLALILVLGIYLGYCKETLMFFIHHPHCLLVLTRYVLLFLQIRAMYKNRNALGSPSISICYEIVFCIILSLLSICLSSYSLREYNDTSFVPTSLLPPIGSRVQPILPPMIGGKIQPNPLQIREAMIVSYFWIIVYEVIYICIWLPNLWHRVRALEFGKSN